MSLRKYLMPSDISPSEAFKATEVPNTPLAQPEQRTGKWIIDDDTEKFMMHCSECGKFQDSRYDRRFLFCPHCGAKMEGDAE